MYQELTCISNAFYARSHLSHSRPSAPGLPLFCQSVEQLKRNLPTTLAGMTGSDLLCEWFMRKMCIVCVLGCLGSHACEAEKRERQSKRDRWGWSRKDLVIVFSSYRGQSTCSIKYYIITSHLHPNCHNDSLITHFVLIHAVHFKQAADALTKNTTAGNGNEKPSLFPRLCLYGKLPTLLESVFTTIFLSQPHKHLDATGCFNQHIDMHSISLSPGRPPCYLPSVLSFSIFPSSQFPLSARVRYSRTCDSSAKAT